MAQQLELHCPGCQQKKYIGSGFTYKVCDRCQTPHCISEGSRCKVPGCTHGILKDLRHS